ncbi:unnamed protein product [Moneuplotes crassus]|uniref:AP2/ERF domain-containing protein n=1 Tax=Euplotes crassus TaxID=5936 RepID=A0AAD1UKU2_EUPCR|nr:unnamed protein product [Moneuplotes crassus]
MNTYNNSQIYDQEFLPVCDDSGILEYLEAIYCVCLPTQIPVETQIYSDFIYWPLETGFYMPEISDSYCDQLQDYCQCQIDQSSHPPLKTEAQALDEMLQVELTRDVNKHEENEEVSIIDRKVRKRKARSEKLNIRPRLLYLRKLLLDSKVSGFTRKVKKTRYTTDKYLGRRSQYIGVTKNNVHWQSLINVNRVKKYIGTFLNETEAARTYDLYALAMQGSESCLNFDYTPQEMLEAVEHFLEHNRVKLA